MFAVLLIACFPVRHIFICNFYSLINYKNKQQNYRQYESAIINYNSLDMEKKRVNRDLQKKIPPFHTLLIQQYIDVCQKFKINLLAGSAQINGIQLKKNYPHYYSVPCSIPIYSWDGAEIKIQWNQYQNTKNSSYLWVDLTQKNNQNQSAPMMKYLQVHYSLLKLRKLALQQCKMGPRVAIVGTDHTASQNVSKLLLNYSGKYSMNPIFVDIDPQNSIFIDGSIGVLQFEYKIIQDLYDRPNKICFYYGNRSTKSKTYMEQIRFLSQCVMKKLNKQIKDYKMHGTKQQYPYFCCGLIIQCPRYKVSENKKDYFSKLKNILSIFQCTHILNVGFPQIDTYLGQNKFNIQSIKGPLLQNTQSFINLPRPIKSKIERYFGNESIQLKYKIEQIKIYQLMTQGTENAHCRQINIRQETISKNTVAILHATVMQQQNIDKFALYQRALMSPIACLIRIFNIAEQQITLQVGQQHFLQQFKNNIWVTSVSDQ